MESGMLTKIYTMGERLTEISGEEGLPEGIGCVFLTASRNMKNVLEMADIHFEGEAVLKEVGFSKVEVQQECLWGSLYVPNKASIMGPKYKVLFFINQKHIVIVDDYDFSQRIISRIQMQRIKQANTKGKFIYNFLTEIINRDQIALSQYESKLMELEDKVVGGRTHNIQNAVSPIRNELLVLRGYYDELCDLGKELKENENGYFDKTQRKYFDVFSNRADRLMTKSNQLLEYAKEIKADYQTAITDKQNNTMKFLTVVSTIFMPLTLITSWYGMNFENMPELQNGYPAVIVVSICVVIATIIYFRHKDIF